ncbi:MAG: sedoheptulose 7-phosphate cyclase [Anaerolineales bacterium]|nr:sedoheptulose 7-phosphate cyclase [Anaerolineales bacterium]
MNQRTFKRRVNYQQNIEYEVITSPHLFQPENASILSVGKTENARRFVVLDANVEKYYAAEIRQYFQYHQIEAKIVSIPSGEENKTLESYLALVRELDAFPINRRNEPIIAIGGGVLTDVAGFVASSYRRGLPHIKVPTTLMGYVDASIGIKTGININGNKNRIGSFAAPQKVFLDKTFLKTLPKRHLLNGICEIIKMGIIKDAGLFQLLETYGSQSVAAQFQNEAGDLILNSAIENMLEELEPNLFEEDLMRKVDFGHTFSYGLETRYEANLLHGEAVLLDIVVSSLIAEARGLISSEDISRIFQLVDELGINLNTALLDPQTLWNSLEERTYHRDGLQRVPMPLGLGGCNFVNDIQQNEISSAIKNLQDRIMFKYDHA